MSLVIGIDIGGTNLRVGVVSGLEVIHERRSHADFSKVCAGYPPDIAWEKIIQLTAEAIRHSLDVHPDVLAIGIGFPGFISPATGVVTQSPNLPGLRDADLAGDLTKAVGLPVIVENDATAAAYGEYRLLPSHVDSLVYVGLGTGVGGGLVYQGRPFSGQHGVSMEIGHMIVQPGGRACGCGNHGCMEQYASATGVAASYYESSDDRISAQEVADLARQGNVHAIEAFELAGMSMAMAIADIVKVLDVSTIMIGGGMSHAWDLLAASFSRQLDRDMIPVLKDKIQIQVSQSGDQAGIIGAALLAEAMSVKRAQ